MNDNINNTTSLFRFSKLFSRTNSGDGIEQVKKIVKTAHPKADMSIVDKAYQIAEKAHEGQSRRSGEPYITHPVAVAKILADLGVGPVTIAAALLHDTVEDTSYELGQLRKDFGDEIALLVDGVTKLDKVKYGEHAQAETVRKMIIAMSKDIRVLVIKLADRLHNARTWGFVPGDSARKKAKETLEIYAPLAHRLGIQQFKTELEDLSFSVLEPKLYSEIERLVNQRNPRREEMVNLVTEAIDEDLKSEKIKGIIKGRPKEYYSIYHKMILRGHDFDDIYDLVGIRIIVGTLKECYAILGAVHARWTPIPGRFKDYIAAPKSNLYQSLHTTVIGPNGKSVEIQIRTQDMDKRAEMGVAAHWKYKELSLNGKKEQSQFSSEQANMAWLAHISDIQEENEDPKEFLESLRFEIGAKEIYVFTPKGKVIGLTAGATTVDFAYAVHTEIGHRTMGARLNGRQVPLETQLKTGDVVQIFTSKNPGAGPNKNWLNFVASSKAKNKIKHWFTKERRDESIEHGKEALTKAMRKQNLPLQKLMTKDIVSQLVLLYRYADISALYAAIGEGRVSTQSVIEKILALSTETENPEVPAEELSYFERKVKRQQESSSGILVKGVGEILVKIAKCCTPVPGDEIIGFVTIGAGISVHQKSCQNAIELQKQPERLTEVEWAPNAKVLFLVNIQVEALDRSGLLSDITRVLAENHVNILSASVQTSSARLAKSRFIFEMGDTTHLDRVLNAVRRVEAVYDVYRVKSS